MKLESLLLPVDLDEFRDKYWSRAVLRIARKNQDYYGELLNKDELEDILYTASRAGNSVEELIEEEVARPTRGYNGAVAVLQAGRSLRITGMQRLSLKLGRFARDLEQVISAAININMYLSPPSGKKALARHFDTHDVFVMQLFGHKGWKLYGPPNAAPLEFLPLLHRESVRDMKQYRLQTHAKLRDASKVELKNEFTMEPGDFLYLPRGFWHEASTEPGGVSCHLTVGILPTTYADLLTAGLAATALSDLQLRKSLPIGFATHADARREITSTLASILGDLEKKVDADKALSELISVFHREHKGTLENSFLEASDRSEGEDVGLSTMVRPSKGVVFGVDETSVPAHFVSGANRFEIDSLFVDACRFICKQEQFTPAKLPGQLTDEQKLTLVRQLISQKVLTVAEV